MQFRIRLETATDAARLASLAEKFTNETITITDGNGLRSNAKSLLGTLSAREYSQLWLECENDHYFDFKDFIIE